jgi:hypothetical protein
MGGTGTGTGTERTHLSQGLLSESDKVMLRRNFTTGAIKYVDETGGNLRNYKANLQPILLGVQDLNKICHGPIYSGGIMEAVKKNREILTNVELEPSSLKKSGSAGPKKKVHISSKHNMFRFAPSHNVFLPKYKNQNVSGEGGKTWYGGL